MSITNDLFKEIGVTREELIKYLGVVKNEGEPIHILANKDVVVSQKYTDKEILGEIQKQLQAEGAVKLLAQASKHGVSVEFLAS